MKIRGYKDTDYEKVKFLLVEAGLFDDDWDSRAHYQAKEKEGEYILLAEEGNEIIGCIVIVEDPFASFIFRLAVKENLRKQGIGSKLLEAAEERLAKDGVDEVTIFVKSNNDNLQKYYERRGYLRGNEYRCMYKKLGGKSRQ